MVVGVIAVTTSMLSTVAALMNTSSGPAVISNSPPNDNVLPVGTITKLVMFGDSMFIT
jgi:hypothetical protein